MRNLVCLNFLKRILFLILVFAFIDSYTQNRILPLEKAKDYTGNGGIYYALPRTVIRVNVNIVRIDSYKGPYSLFAEKFLGLEDFIQYDNTIYKIKDIDICSYTEPDPDHIYFVEIEDRDSKRDKQIILFLDESGIIQAINDEHQPAEPEKYKCAGFESGVINSEINDYPEMIFSEFITNNYVETFDTITKVITVDDTSTIEKKVLQSRMIEKTLEQKAEEISQRIYRIQTERNNLLTGYQETAYTKESMQYMNDQLLSMETELLELFKGKSAKSEMVYSFKYIPVADATTESDIIFKFSETSGVLDRYSETGYPVKIELVSSGLSKKIDESSARKAASSDEGFYYRIPEYSDVRIVYDDVTFAEMRMLIEQYGSLVKLPPNKSSILFHENSGNIRRYEVK